jgi:hypothetical protein
MANEYHLGQVVRLSALFKNLAGTAVDPSAVFFAWKRPTGVVVTKQYGIDGEVIKDSTGAYHCDVEGDLAGFWYYRPYGTGTNRSAKWSDFRVIANPVA